MVKKKRLSDYTLEDIIRLERAEAAGSVEARKELAKIKGYKTHGALLKSIQQMEEIARSAYLTRSYANRLALDREALTESLRFGISVLENAANFGFDLVDTERELYEIKLNESAIPTPEPANQEIITELRQLNKTLSMLRSEQTTESRAQTKTNEEIPDNQEAKEENRPLGDRARELGILAKVLKRWDKIRTVHYPAGLTQEEMAEEEDVTLETIKTDIRKMKKRNLIN